MKSTLLVLLFIQTQILNAQTFKEVPFEFDGVGLSSVAFSDVNGDGYYEALITGENSSGSLIANLCSNNSTGGFSAMTDQPFVGVRFGSTAFSDVNGDGYNDVLITGLNSSFERIAQLYTNDGIGTFTEKTETPFDGVSNSSIAFSDVNGDGYNDVLIAGLNNSAEQIAKLYTNDGTGTFTEMPNTPFDGVWLGSVAFSDINSDGHDDVLLTGLNSSGERIAKLYTNDGAGVFTEITAHPFDGVSDSSIAFSDVNGDGYDDVLITGLNSSAERIAKLYTNDGTGTFTEMTNTPFDGVSDSSVAFSDVNSDGYGDILITGQKSSGERIAKLYTNDGTGIFTEITDTPFEGVRVGSVALSDVNGDGYNDVLITGLNNSGVLIAKLYTNDGPVSFAGNTHFTISTDLVLFPNPSTTATLLLRYNSPEMGTIIIKVYDTNGRLLLQQKEYAIIGQQAFSIDMTTLNGGTYFLELAHGQRKKVVPFIVQ